MRFLKVAPSDIWLAFVLIEDEVCIKALTPNLPLLRRTVHPSSHARLDLLPLRTRFHRPRDQRWTHSVAATSCFVRRKLHAMKSPHSFRVGITRLHSHINLSQSHHATGFHDFEHLGQRFDRRVQMPKHLTRVHDVKDVFAESLREFVDAGGLESDVACYADLLRVCGCSRDDVRAQVDGGDVA